MPKTILKSDLNSLYATFQDLMRPWTKLAKTTKILRKSFATSKTLWPHCKRLWLRDANLPQKRSCLHFTKTGWFTKRNICTSLSRVFVLRRSILFSLFASVYLSLNWPVKGAICPWFYENWPLKKSCCFFWLLCLRTYITYTHSTIGNRSQQMLH